jgi:hypothetical protein
MKRNLLLVLLLSLPLYAFQKQTGSTSTTTPAKKTQQQPSSSSSDYYTNVDGKRVHRPVHAATAPAGATAKCRDGSYSFSQYARGTCSHHGGVATWLRH